VTRQLHVILERRAIDSVLFSEMKRRVERLRELGVGGFRTPSKHGYFSAIDVMRQGFEIFFELTPSRTRYMEARGLIRATVSDDPKTMDELLEHFAFFCDSILAIYTEERKIESVGPRTIFLEGTPYPADELMALFKVLGVKAPLSLAKPFRKLVYLDHGFPHYPDPDGRFRSARLTHWASEIRENMPDDGSKALLKASRECVLPPRGFGELIRILRGGETLADRLGTDGIELEVVGETFDLDEKFGIKSGWL